MSVKKSRNLPGRDLVLDWSKSRGRGRSLLSIPNIGKGADVHYNPSNKHNGIIDASTSLKMQPRWLSTYVAQ